MFSFCRGAIDPCTVSSIPAPVPECVRVTGAAVTVAAVVVVVVVMMMVACWQRGYWFALFRQTLFGDGYSWVDNTDHVVIA